MKWFGIQIGPGGRLVPVAFDEHPKETPSLACDLIPGTLRPIPPEMQRTSLAELAAWNTST